MKVITFRFLGEENQPTGWVGMVAGRDWKELFCAIDEFGDPYSCDYKTLSMGSGVCWHERWEGDEGPDVYCYKIDETELSERMSNSRDDGWRPFPVDKVRGL